MRGTFLMPDRGPLRSGVTPTAPASWVRAGLEARGPVRPLANMIGAEVLKWKSVVETQKITTQ